MVRYVNLETGEEFQDKSRADELHKSGVRIQVRSDGVPVAEWIPGSHDYHAIVNGKKMLREFDVKIPKGGI